MRTDLTGWDKSIAALKLAWNLWGQPSEPWFWDEEWVELAVDAGHKRGLITGLLWHLRQTPFVRVRYNRDDKNSKPKREYQFDYARCHGVNSPGWRTLVVSVKFATDVRGLRNEDEIEGEEGA